MGLWKAGERMKVVTMKMVPRRERTDPVRSIGVEY